MNDGRINRILKNKSVQAAGVVAFVVAYWVVVIAVGVLLIVALLSLSGCYTVTIQEEPGWRLYHHRQDNVAGRR